MAGSRPSARRRSFSSTPARFPTETNRENPIRSAIPYWRMPAHSAPLWETNAMFPRGGRFSLNVALRLNRRVGVEEPEAVRADQRHPVLLGLADQFLLERHAVASDLPEPGRDHDDPARAGAAEFDGPRRHDPRRHDDDPKIRGFGQMADVGVTVGRPRRSTRRGSRGRRLPGIRPGGCCGTGSFRPCRAGSRRRRRRSTGE